LKEQVHIAYQEYSTGIQGLQQIFLLDFVVCLAGWIGVCFFFFVMVFLVFLVEGGGVFWRVWSVFNIQ